MIKSIIDDHCVTKNQGNVENVFQLVDESAFTYGVKGFSYIKYTGYCWQIAINSQQDVGFKDKKVVFSRVTCSVGKLEVWDRTSAWRIFYILRQFLQNRIWSNSHAV